MADEQTDDAARISAWFETLRRVTFKALDAVEAAARDDDAFRRDLLRLVGGVRGDLTTISSVGNLTDLHEEPAPRSEEPIEPPYSSPSPVTESATRTPSSAPAQAHIDLIQPPRVVDAGVARYPREWSAEPFEPERVASRCRLKANACRWQTQRSQHLDAGEDVSAGDQELVARARANDVYLWMISPAKWRERTEEAFDVVGGCYEALADAAELMGLSDRLARNQETAMKLLAEAQSGLRAAIEDYAGTRRDEDQEATFTWLRGETEARCVFVEFMQLNHPAPPHNYIDLQRRIGAARAGFNDVLNRDRTVRDALRKLGWHAQKLARLPAGVRADHNSDDMRGIAASMEALFGVGVPATDVRLRDALLPVFDRMPDDEDPIPAALARVLEAIDEYLDQRDDAAADAEATLVIGPDDDRIADPLVAGARRIVQGRHAILIGGRPREAHRRRLELGLGLRSLDWLHVEHGQSFDKAAAAIRRPGVGLVLVMTRWRSHRDGPAARATCKEFGVSLVELPSGYNLRQVANQIVAQGE